MILQSTILTALFGLSVASTMSNQPRQLQGVGNGNPRKMTAPCALILRVEQFEDHTDAYEWNCELDHADGGDIVSIPDMKFDKDQFKSGISTLFGDVTIYGGRATINGNPVFGRRDSQNNVGDRRLVVGEERSVLAIRVVGNDIETTANSATISDEIFGTSGDSFNLSSGFSQCSNNQLNFVPTTIAGTNGVYTVTLNQDIAGFTNSELQNLVVNTATAELGTLSAQFDHVMLCLPNIAGFGGIAYAYINSWLSVYKDAWCLYPSAQLHEIGHNINLAHSNEGTTTYADQSGMMGYSYSQDEGPRMCFNNAKIWQLGWYSDRRAIVTPLTLTAEWSGQLVGFSEYGSSAITQTVVLKVEGDEEDYYVGFNRKSGINSGTVEGGNQVTIQKRQLGTGYAESILVAKLSGGGSYVISNFGGSSETVTIEVVSIDLASTPSVATVKVFRDQAPTPSPTASPTASPTISSNPTASPTKAPTGVPTPSPSASPTFPVTPNPTRSPVVLPDCSAITSSKTCKATSGCAWAKGLCVLAVGGPTAPTPTAPTPSAPTPTAPTPTAPTPTGDGCSSYTALGAKGCKSNGCVWSKGLCVDP